MAVRVIPANLAAAGHVAKTFGFKGQLRLRLQHDDYYELLRKGEFVFLVLEGKPVPFLITDYDENANALTLHLVDSEEKAKALEGAGVLFDSEELAELNPLAGLQGYLLVDQTLGEIGRIEEVLEYPGQLLLRIFNRQELVPLAEDLIVKTDRRKRQLIMDLPEGLFSL